MIATNLRKGTAVIMDGSIFICVEYFHGTPGKGRGFVQVSLKNISTGKIYQKKLASNETVEQAYLEPKNCQFLYKDDAGYHFMEMDTFHNFPMSEEMLGDQRFYLKENMEVKIHFHNDKPVLPEFPKSVTLKVTEAPPWVKGDSVSNNLKPIVLETGLKLQAPIFIKEGEIIKVNTETGDYGGRA